MKEKGFTLIELLAVIVILAIIALIATPIVLNIIEDSKKSAFKQTGNGIVDAAEYYYMKEMSDGVKPTENKVFAFDGTTNGLEGLEFDGEIPKEGTLTVDVNGNIELVAHNNQYCLTKGYNQNEITIKDYDGTCSIPVCTLVSGTAKTPGAKYECNVDPSKDAYTFYVLGNNEDGTTNLIMNQNINSDGTPAGTTGVSKAENASVYNTVAWQSSGKVEDGPVTAMEFLYNATKNWTNVPALNYEYYDKEYHGSTLNGEYGYTSFISENGVLAITSGTEPAITTTIGTAEEPLRARMPIYAVVYNFEDDTTTPKGEVTNKKDDNSNSYLYENMSGLNLFGYWTLSASDSSSYSDCAWGVSSGGYLDTAMDYDFSSDRDTEVGVRPVITLQL